MNIQNIQIAQGLFRTVEERLNARKENISSPHNISVRQVDVADVQNKTAETPKISMDKDLLAVIYPPFFPIGNTQEILNIEGVKQISGENVKSASSVNVEEHKAIQQKNIQNKTTNTEASTVQDEITRSAGAFSNDQTPSVKEKGNPGVVLDFKV